MPSPSLTVIIPTYNRAQMLWRCVESVVGPAQADLSKRGRLSVVVVDDGSSSPDAIETLHKLEAVFPSEVLTVMRMEVNSGGAAAPRNAALDTVTSDYIFFVDSDDFLGAGAIDRVLKLLETHQPDYLYLNSVNEGRRTDKSNAIEVDYVERDMLQALKSLVVRRVFKVEVIRRLGLRFDEYLKSGQDVLFAFQFLLNATSFGFAGNFDYYHLVEHAAENEDGHLSRKGGDDGFDAATRAAYFSYILQKGLVELSVAAHPEALKERIAATVLLSRFLRSAPPRIMRIRNTDRQTGILRDVANTLNSPIFPEKSVSQLQPAQKDLANSLLQKDFEGFLARCRAARAAAKMAPK